MANQSSSRYLGEQNDCYFETDPRINKELAQSLAGKNVVVAGAGRGIGRTCAEFLTFASAKSISLTALELSEVEETARLCKSINPSVKTKVAAFDVRDAANVETFVLEIEEEFGSIDVLHMNAGRPPQWLPTSQCDPKIWWDTLAISLQGAFNFSRYVIPIMQKRKDGRIIFTSSAAAHANSGVSSYILGKLGMVRLCEIIHAENFKDYNIKCFAFQPGRIRTRFFTDFKDKVDGHDLPDSYVIEGVENEDKSAQTAINFFKGATWDTPYMPAGLVTVLAAGQLDFMSGRYLDAAKHISEYVNDQTKIQELDLHRIRLHADSDVFIPRLDI